MSLLISVWGCLGGCVLWEKCKSRMEYRGDFLVRTPPEMVLWEGRQLGPFSLHCCFESRISLGEKSKLQATVTENRLSNFDPSWLTRKKEKKKLFEFYRQMMDSCFNWTLMNKPHAIRQFNIHACITLEKKLSGLLETVCNIMQLSICGAPKEVRFFGVFIFRLMMFIWTGPVSHGSCMLRLSWNC